MPDMSMTHIRIDITCIIYLGVHIIYVDIIHAPIGTLELGLDSTSKTLLPTQSSSGFLFPRVLKSAV